MALPSSANKSLVTTVSKTSGCHRSMYQSSSFSFTPDDYPIFTMALEDHQDPLGVSENKAQEIAKPTNLQEAAQEHRNIETRTASAIQGRRVSSTYSMERGNHTRNLSGHYSMNYSDTPMHSSNNTPALVNGKPVTATPAVVSLAELQDMIGLPPKSSSRSHNNLNIGSSSNIRSWFSSLAKKGITSNKKDQRAIITEDWNLTLEGLRQKLLHASIKRDVALSEVRQLKCSISSLEDKLKRVESYCDDLKASLNSAMENTSIDATIMSTETNIHFFPANFSNMKPITFEGMVEAFLRTIAEARSSVRQLCRTFLVILQEEDSGSGLEKLNSMLRTYGIDSVQNSKVSRAALYHVEALFNQALYQDFENSSFQRNGCQGTLDPYKNCTSNFASFNSMKSLDWDEVLSKGTKFFSENFSRFCDQKMSLIVSMLSLSTNWPEKLLQTFFVAAKSVWLVHLLAFSFHPPLTIFRVEASAKFDGVYMEDILAERLTKTMAVPALVRIMVMPGFYIHNNVIKCKVLCRYHK